MKKQVKSLEFSLFKAPISNVEPLKTINLLKLHELVTGERYRGVTAQIQSRVTKEDKSKLKGSKLDYICPSGIFSKRSNNDLLSYSGLLVLDIDSLGDVDSVFSKLVNDDLIDLRLMFRSPSGNGLKVIVETRGDQEKHQHYFEAYSNYLKQKYNIALDNSGKDLSRACFLCYDKNAYCNVTENDKVTFPFEEWVTLATPVTNNRDVTAIYEQVRQVVNEIIESSVDLTQGYDNWLKIGFSLADCLKEQGRQFFHQVSELNEAYNCQETDDKYSELLRAKGHGITIKTFFYLAHEAGISLKTGNDSNATHNKLEKLENWLSERYSLRYNELRSTVEIKAIDHDNWSIINDRIFNSILMDIKRDGIRCSSDLLGSLINSDFVKGYNPFKNYLGSLPPWDQKDHIGKLTNLLEVENKDFWRLSFRKWIVALVASLLNKKVVNQQVIVLCGPQGIGKTTWIMNLIPDDLQEYVYSGTINPGNKDSLAMLAEMILINLDEMDNMNRSDSGTLKSLITTKQVTLRKAYGRFSETRHRIASFVGSVNDQQFLNDPTGSRRFLVIDTTKINYKASFDLGQVYQQAVNLYESGYKYYFESEEIELIERNNETFQKTSFEEDLVLKYFEPIAWATARDFFTASEILDYVNCRTSLNLQGVHSIQVGKALAKNKFEKGKKDGVYKWAVKIKV